MKRLSLLLLLLVLAAFVAGLVQLFQLRFEAGDIYPEYSSLRTDPLGAKALYESLDKLLSASRNYQAFAKLGDGRRTTLFYLGAEPHDLRFLPNEFKDLETFVATGGRLVISLFPSYQKPRPNRFLKTTNAPPARGGQKKFPSDDAFADLRKISIRERWNLEFAHAELTKDEKEVYQPALAFRQQASDLPESISCHTALCFTNLHKAWRVIYGRAKEQAVLMERKLGDGTIVLCADSYYFSNEALLKERQPALLAWLVGPSRRAVFDETHLGVEESPGLAALARQYRLHGLFAGLLLLAGLFVWKNSVSFVPPCESQARRAEADLIAGKESAAGFVNLLRRNIPSREILGLCLTEWKKSCAHQVPRAKLEQIQAVIDAENNLRPNQRDPIQTYRAISRILAERKFNVKRET